MVSEIIYISSMVMPCTIPVTTLQSKNLQLDEISYIM
nr:MAG TPA: hypothetical protein [Crassvirales sp.]